MTDIEMVPVEHLPYYNELTTCLPYAESKLRTVIATAIGAASSCWVNLSGAGVFDSSRAGKVAEDLCTEVIRLTTMGEPALGCATTSQLLEELKARIDLVHGGLDYKTMED